MKKQFPLRAYFGRARIFGYVLVIILLGIAVYLLYTFLNS